MDDLVQLAKDKDVAIITINNPPVNALSPGVAKAIAQTIAQVGDDDGVKAVVLIGGGRTFIAGADIKELGKITSGKTQRGRGGLASAPASDRRCAKTSSGGHALLCLWRRAGTGDGRALSCGGSECTAGSARSEAGHYSRRRWHPAAASAGGRRQGRRDVRRRQSDYRSGGAETRSRRSSDRRRSVAGCHSFLPRHRCETTAQNSRAERKRET